MKNILLLSIFIFSALCISGCGNDETPPMSRERTQLIVRLFESMEKNDRATTINRAEKLKKLAPENEYLDHVLETYTAQTYIIHAQKAINEGHHDLALQILAKGLQKHPLNHILNAQHKNLQTLLELENAVRKGELHNVPEDLEKIPGVGPRLVKKIKSAQEKNN